MYFVVEAAVAGALDAGARYADARVIDARAQSIDVKNGAVESVDDSDSLGVGVRALIGSSWGFYATDDLSDPSVRRAGEQSATIARASALVPGDDLVLADVPIEETSYATPVAEDPFAVPLAEKVELLLNVTASMHEMRGVDLATAKLNFWVADKWFASSQGHRIHQHIVESGGGFDATAIGDHETQRRSYPQSFGQYETGGYEVVRKWAFDEHATRIADEAAALIHAPVVEPGEKDVILGGSQVALQIHESVGHAIELDRILGWEAAFAGTSHLELARLGHHRYGSDIMNITADATLPGALGTFGFDDEGTPAQRVDIVSEGRWVGVLSGRDSAGRAGVAPGGMVRSDGFNRLPMVRMTNVGLLAGSSSLDEIISETGDGILMDTNRSWSIDDKRLNFQFGCEVAYEIKKGKKGRMLRNPTYTGITPQFWASLDMLAGGDEHVHWGTPNCGKGQPMQIAHTGHSAAPARFRGIRVGVGG